MANISRRLTPEFVRSKPEPYIQNVALICYGMTRYIADHSGMRVIGADPCFASRESIVLFKRVGRNGAITMSSANRDYKQFRNICSRELKRIDPALKLQTFTKEKRDTGVGNRVHEVIKRKRTSLIKLKRGGDHRSHKAKK